MGISFFQLLQTFGFADEKIVHTPAVPFQKKFSAIGFYTDSIMMDTTAAHRCIAVYRNRSAGFPGQNSDNLFNNLTNNQLSFFKKAILSSRIFIFDSASFCFAYSFSTTSAGALFTKRSF